MSHERCFTSVNVGVRHESKTLTWEPTDSQWRETSRWRGTDVFLQPPWPLMTLRDSSVLLYTWEHCSWHKSAKKSGSSLWFFVVSMEIQVEKMIYWSMIDQNCGILIPKATRTGIKRRMGGYKHSVRSISMVTGSKIQHLLQVSLQLINNLKNTFLLHRHIW